MDELLFQNTNKYYEIKEGLPFTKEQKQCMFCKKFPYRKKYMSLSSMTVSKYFLNIGIISWKEVTLQGMSLEVLYKNKIEHDGKWWFS